MRPRIDLLTLTARAIVVVTTVGASGLAIVHSLAPLV
jgi:hypothetical protein